MANAYLKQRHERDLAVEAATRQTYLQYMTDLIEITLNDPEAMGGRPFGAQKIETFLHVLSAHYDDYLEALDAKHDEADYKRERLEGKLAQIFPEDKLIPFMERYDYLKELPSIGGKKRMEEQK